MNVFSASEAALEGFRLTRERPGTIAAWSLINFVGVTTIGLAMMLSLGAPLIEYIKKGGLNSIHPEELAAVLTASWPAFFGIMAVVILFLSIMTAGIFRIVLRPGEKGFAHLRLGKDELRLSAVNLMLLPMGLVFLAIVDLVGAMVATRSGNLAGLVAAALVAAPMVWVGVRLSLATLPDDRTPTKADWTRLSQRWRHHLDARIDYLERLRSDLVSCIGCGCLSLATCRLHNRDDDLAREGTGARLLRPEA